LPLFAELARSLILGKTRTSTRITRSWPPLVRRTKLGDLLILLIRRFQGGIYGVLSADLFRGSGVVAHPNGPAVLVPVTLINVAKYRHFDFGMGFGTDC
jgi:hypothetical protein